MDFLLSHWNCILPVAGIAAALFFMREKPTDKKEDGDSTAISQKTSIDEKSFGRK